MHKTWKHACKYITGIPDSATPKSAYDSQFHYFLLYCYKIVVAVLKYIDLTGKPFKNYAWKQALLNSVLHNSL